MRLPTVIPLALALLVPASAQAAPAASARLVACDVEARTADVTGDMRAIPGTDRMQMRFSVLVREPGAARFDRVQARGLDTWVTSAPGRARYVYDKHVENLQPGSYRMLVRFRWRAADGTLLRRATRRSRACHVPDPRPDLTPVRVDVQPGATEATRTYIVVVANRGRAAAPAFNVSLQVGDLLLPDRRAPALRAGERLEVAFDGPACAPGELLVADVDATGVVDEAQEDDDVVGFPCPAV